ncbi:hypothetical protein [Amycolatopsis sp. NPDC051071]|uniref:hypothetical protein n=1 Tax=Amycolatopsis sp. NPDC051071 TaxID=3154637 RepID=UPI0034416083
MPTATTTQETSRIQPQPGGGGLPAVDGRAEREPDTPRSVQCRKLLLDVLADDLAEQVLGPADDGDLGRLRALVAHSRVVPPDS